MIINEAKETLLDNVLKFLNNRKGKNDKDTKNYYLNGSISKKTQSLVMTFPMMCDDTLPPDTASMINRANENNIVSMLRMLFASMSLTGNDGAEILELIHSNIKTNYDINDIIDSMENYIAANEATIPQKDINPTVVRKIIEECRHEINYGERFDSESLNEMSINDYRVSINYKGEYCIAEANSDSRRPYGSDQYPIYDKNGNPVLDRNGNQVYGNKYNEYDKNKDADQRSRQMKKDEYEKQRDKKRDEYQAQKDEYERNKDAQQTQMNYIQKQILDQDIKKINDMAPTLLVVQYNETDEGGKYIKTKDFISGVKSRLIAVDSQDIIERLVSKNRTKLNFFNFIKAFTGETKLVKDFFLCIDQAKINAKNAAKKGMAAQMWRVLEDRSINNAKNKAAKNGNDASAITVLTINRETVNEMKNQYDFDLDIIKNARLILDAYNLLGIIIADESNQTAKFLYDGNDSWETQAYSYIQKENRDNSSTKKIINLLGTR